MSHDVDSPSVACEQLALRDAALTANEIYAHYLRRTASTTAVIDIPARRAEQSDQEYYESFIDPIDPSLPACIDVHALFANAPDCAKPYLAFLLDGGHRQARPVAMVDLREDGESNDYSGGPRGNARPPTQAVQDVLWNYLTQHVHLFERYTGDVAARAGSFFVVKESSGKYRVIVDGRPANFRTPTEGFSFPIFSLDALLQVQQNMSRGDADYFAVTFDIRHQFHQIPMPKYLKKFFVIDAGRERHVAPRALPMGWALSPAAGQAITWSLLLAKGTDEAGSKSNGGRRYAALDRERCGLDRELAEQLLSASELPPWLPLRCGGAIFVMLDGALILTKDESVATYWKQRIVEQAERFGIILKSAANDETVRLDHLRANGDAEFEFMGIQFQHARRRVKIKRPSQSAAVVAGGGAAAAGGAAQTKELVPGDIKERCWAGTHRQLSAALGTLLWYHRVHQTGRASLDRLFALYRKATPQPGVSWDAAVIGGLSQGETTVLLRHWDERQKNAWARSEPLEPVGVIAFGAADASGARGASSGLVAAVYYPDLDASAERLVVGTLTSNTYDNIAVAETQAVLRTVQLLVAHRPQADCLVIATDSMVAKSWIERTYALDDAAQKLIRTLVAALQKGRRRRLFLTYVPTESNVADTPSRKPEDVAWEESPKWSAESDATRVAATAAVLRVAERFARGLWSQAGGAVGATGAARRRQREDEVSSE